WAPAGFNLAWTTPMMLPAILVAPLTVAFGPVVAYNVLCVLAPAIAAWTCFFLCRKITASYLAAMAGGYIFGFSAYSLAETRGHPLLVFVFPLPLAMLLTLYRLEGRLSAWRYSLLTATVLGVTF